MTMAKTSPSRLDGLDLARYLAFAGMVFVNFQLAMHPSTDGFAGLAAMFEFLEGKASATFVVLAGLSLVLATRSKTYRIASRWVLRRSLFLLCVGMLNLLVFPADIIHYYAVYFLLAIPLLRAKPAVLAGTMLLIAVVSSATLLSANYSQGWDWQTLQYRDLWMATGFVRNLFFNGFHPVLPWLALFVYGMVLASLPLQRPSLQWALLLAGLAMGLLASALAHLWHGSELAWLLGTTPMPPGPIYLLMGISSASVVLGACLRLASCWPDGLWRVLLPAGRMTLSLYLAHILIGMGLLEALEMLDGSQSLLVTAIAAVSFLLPATAAAWLWNRKKPHGPVEELMRRLTS